MDTSTQSTERAEVVNPKFQISKVILNRVISELDAKVEMVLRESGNDIVEANYSKYRRRRGGMQKAFALNLRNTIKTNLENIYGKQIADADNNFKNMRFSIEQLETQYQGILSNYGITYNAGYRNPFNEVKDMCNDSILGKSIASERINKLTALCKIAQDKIVAIGLNVKEILTTETNRLNTSQGNVRKQSRINLLHQFAEAKLTELIQIRDEFKRSITSEYETFTKERVAKSYEDHGPTAIL